MNERRVFEGVLVRRGKQTRAKRRADGCPTAYAEDGAMAPTIRPRDPSLSGQGLTLAGVATGRQHTTQAPFEAETAPTGSER